jgi:Tfp pilus assembly protein FimT
MKRKMLVLALSLVIAYPLFAQSKEDERLANSATVLQES